MLLSTNTDQIWQPDVRRHLSLRVYKSSDLLPFNPLEAFSLLKKYKYGSLRCVMSHSASRQEHLFLFYCMKYKNITITCIEREVNLQTCLPEYKQTPAQSMPFLQKLRALLLVKIVIKFLREPMEIPQVNI